MNDLDKLYREAPQLETSTSLDESILAAARLSVPVKARTPSRWRVAGYAVSYLCVFGIGLGVLFKSGFFPSSRSYLTNDEVIAESVSVNGVARKTTSQSVQQSSSSVANGSANIAADNQLVIPQQLDNLQRSRAAEKLFIEEQSVAADALVPNSISSEQVDVASTEIAQSPEQSFTLSRSAGSLDSEAETNNESIRQKTVTDSVASVASVAATATVTRRTVDWLLMQIEELYTVQIAQSDSSDNLLTLAQQASMASELIKLDTTATGWVLIFGSFKNKDNAAQVMNELLQTLPPSALDGPVTIAPQIVTFKDLQRRIE